MISRPYPSSRPGYLINLPRLSYRTAWDLQKKIHQGVVDRDTAATILILEHDPVITLGRHAGWEHVLASPDRLMQLGIGCERVERGGDVTYHGPGQLVAYPILNLGLMGWGVKEFVRRLEEGIITTLADLDLPAGRRIGYPGVYIGPRKIASLGLAVRHRVSFHGLALNCDPDMSHFQLIRPCGLVDVQMTSLTTELGQCPPVEKVRSSLSARLGQALNLDLSEISLSVLEGYLDQSDIKSNLFVKKATSPNAKDLRT
ncbi:MAG: lipoyl(octanoyl) transferase LipB [Deltaproteobacteria bacterium]|nr:lipoyl(octanoyl) transferase LipB [Deltaproteobacteria bacterium]